ncbi:MAG: TatD family hydrolase [Deltaproteobacteria bacterium]|nr:TatD family hydrolase [Deltaproteobacteria bacterium]
MTFLLIDCHAHLTHPQFSSDRGQVLAQARQRGVGAVVVVGEDEADNQAVLAGPGPGENQPAWLPFLGLHPDRWADTRHTPQGPQALPPAENLEEQLARVEAQIRENRHRIAGVGEVGLDRWVCQQQAPRQAQAQALIRLAALAKALDLPLNVHSRSAGRVTLELLREHQARRVLMHAFDGKAGHALEGARAGYLFSIPPSVLRSPQKENLVRALPLESLLLETDSPVLGPDPRGRNEPANLPLVVEAVARLKGIPPGEVAERTTATARAWLGWAG